MAVHPDNPQCYKKDVCVLQTARGCFPGGITRIVHLCTTCWQDVIKPEEE